MISNELSFLIFMIESSSPLVQQTQLKLAMVENLVSVMSMRCWETDNDSPTNSVDPVSLENFREILKRIDHKLLEIESATDITTTSDQCQHDLVRC